MVRKDLRCQTKTPLPIVANFWGSPPQRPLLGLSLPLYRAQIVSAAAWGPLKEIDAGALRIGYAEMGPSSGPVAILLHGWPYDLATSAPGTLRRD
jgi:hypothetical protein